MASQTDAMDEGTAARNEDQLWRALRSTAPVASLIEIVNAWKSSGCTKNDAESRLTAFVGVVRARGTPDQEDPVLDVLDAVVGWCVAEGQIFP